jgi:DNA-binding MarR family transcriptional regulator
MKKIITKGDLAAWRAFITAHAEVIGAISKEMESAGQVPLSSYDVLVALSESPGHRLRMHELARDVILSRSALTRLVDRLEGQGLLHREQCGTDRRGAYAVLTDAGREALDSAWPVYGRSIQRRFVDHLSDDELAVIRTAMSRIAAAEGHPLYAEKDSG